MQATRSTTKMKNLIKGFRCLSQAFGEKEEEMKIGNPTDVKHVAHIGYDGPSTDPTPPTWMNGFKSSEEVEDNDSSSVKCRSECGVNLSKDLTKPPKTTKKSLSEKGSPTKTDKSDKTKRRSSTKATSSSRRFKEKTSSKSDIQDSSENIPKKSKRKKAKDVSVNGPCCSLTSSRTTSDFDDSFSDSLSVKSLSRFNDDTADVF